jgi:predicted kinase
MRKWMRDRLMRRKKAAASKTESSEQKPAPLQPAYFEAGPADEEPAPEPVENSSSFEPEEPAVEPVSETASGPAESSTPAVSRPKRRRRGRGGRGRKKSAAAPTPAVETAPPPIVPVLAPQAETKPAAPLASPRVQQAYKGTVVLAIGLPGSGKSSWFKRHKINPLSSDLLRGLLFDNPDEQRYQDLVFSNLRNMLRARLIARRPMNYVDATNLTPQERQGWIKMATDYSYEVQAVYFDVPLEVCMERNHRRHRVIGDDIMRRMAGKLKPPTFDEGFSKITVVRVKKSA